MGSEPEKVYVAAGTDPPEGLKTLEWTLKRWNSQSISVVILHVTSSNSKDFVYTPFGKLPASAVSDEKLQALKKYEETQIEKLLSVYTAVCGKVKAEIMRIEKHDEPIHDLVLDLITEHKITKLVMGIAFIKSPSWKQKNAMSSLFNIHQNRPEFCEFFVISEGKMVFLKGDSEEGIMEDDRGVTLAKMREKGSRRNWFSPKKSAENNYSSASLGRMNSRLLSISSSKSFDSPVVHNQWESYAEEVENYFQHLLSLNLDYQKFDGQDESSQINPTDATEYADSNLDIAERMEMVRSKISEAQEKVQLKKKEVKLNAERSSKAEWAIRLCNNRGEQLDSLVKEEINIRTETQKTIDRQKDQLQEAIRDIEESKNKLNSLIELKSELSNKLQLSTMAKRRVEGQLDNAIVAREDLVREIEDLRRQRDVLHRRIEFCKEKDAIGKVTKASEMSYGFREYTADDIQIATDNFSERLRLKVEKEGNSVYRGRINHATFAFKLLNSVDGLSEKDFQDKVKLLINIRHPNLVAMMGFCLELKCLVYEYMHNGNLGDLIFSSQRKYSRALRWPDRIRVSQEVCSGLGFLHLAEPRPIVHGNLVPSKILLDRNLVAKTTGFGLNGPYEEKDLRSDIRAFGEILWSLLTGKKWAGPNEEAMKLDRTALEKVLDKKAGKWPLDLAENIAGIARKCLSNEDTSVGDVMKMLDEVRKKAEGLVEREKYEMMIDRGTKKNEHVPNVFICPIYQEVMKNPYVADNGVSYEKEAIEEWLAMGHDTSPMTNLKLKSKTLTPNHTLRSLIQDWQAKNSVEQNKGRKTERKTVK